MSRYMDAIIAGFGGQGVMLIGNLLAYAGMNEGLNVTYIPVYGPEMRGGTANCKVVISDDTRIAVANLFACEDLGRHRLKGFEKPVRAWSVLDEEAVENRFAAIRPDYDRIPLIGREMQCDSRRIPRREPTRH